MDRVIWRLTGTEVLPFLQGLVTNDVLPLQKAPGAVWAALLTPQGKYLADFFVIHRPGADGEYLLDIAADLATATLRRLTMYKLRADVQIAESGLVLSRGLGEPPAGAVTDPRDPALGWRLYAVAALPGTDAVDWDALRVRLLVPEFPADLRPDDSYILEMGFERLHGVDFRKGCYVGQEVTARMKHKTELRKGLLRVVLEGVVAPGTAITTADGREAGRIGTVAGDQALAWLRHDRAQGQLMAEGKPLRAELPA